MRNLDARDLAALANAVNVISDLHDVLNEESLAIRHVVLTDEDDNEIGTIFWDPEIERWAYEPKRK
jgi:hypothetical protein